MATVRLYHDDSTRTRFGAAIVSASEDSRGTWVELDETAFYPTSGGQPHDLGTLDGIPVLDVEDRDDHLFHRVEVLPKGPRVEGIVDWARRLDHMQQHTAQHMLTRVLLDDTGTRTIGFHIGPAVSNIDLDRADLPAEIWPRTEDRLAALIREARPVVVSWTSAKDASALGLRKIPEGLDELRVITIEGLDRTACGGTHVRSTHEIESVLLLGTENVGSRCRLYYVAGERARRDHRKKHEVATRLAGKLSTSIDEIENVFGRTLLELQETRKELRARQRELAVHRLAAWVSGIPAPRILTRRLEPNDLDATFFADALSRLESTVLVLGWTATERAHILLARTADLDIALAPILASALCHVEGRGGGGPSRAQGAGPKLAGLDDALRDAERAIRRALEGPRFA